MNQEHSQNISLFSVDMILMIDNVTQDKNETKKSIIVNIKKNNRRLCM